MFTIGGWGGGVHTCVHIQYCSLAHLSFSKILYRFLIYLDSSLFPAVRLYAVKSKDLDLFVHFYILSAWESTYVA